MSCKILHKRHSRPVLKATSNAPHLQPGKMCIWIPLIHVIKRSLVKENFERVCRQQNSVFVRCHQRSVYILGLFCGSVSIRLLLLIYIYRKLACLCVNEVVRNKGTTRPSHPPQAKCNRGTSSRGNQTDETRPIFFCFFCLYICHSSFPF